jgi:predicted thioesterase
MKDSLQQGLKTTRRIEIDRARTIDFMGEEGRVYATPALVQDIEVTCRDLLLDHLDPGEDSVGTRVEVDHLAATLEGMWVEITATIAALDGRAASFEVTARDAVDDVARGRHNRFVVDVEKTKARLAAKAAKAKTE